jgi:putative ABC transport system substrate-binding protein
MRRREFISLVGVVSFAWPRAVIAQVSPRRALIAHLFAGSSTANTHSVSAFSQGLQELGYVEGRNIDIVYRYGDGDPERLPLLADELVRLKPDVIVTGSPDAVLAVKQATVTIPIVCTALTDPVAQGLVESQARPGGQVTGISTTSEGLTGKRLALLLELVPGATRIGMMFTSRSRGQAPYQQEEARAAAKALGVTLVPVDIRAANELNAGFQTFVRERVKLVLILGDALFWSERRQIADLATAAQLPTSYSFREYPVAGGLMSYGVNVLESTWRAAAYVDKILKGSKPGDCRSSSQPNWRWSST